MEPPLGRALDHRRENAPPNNRRQRQSARHDQRRPAPCVASQLISGSYQPDRAQESRPVPPSSGSQISGPRGSLVSRCLLAFIVTISLLAGLQSASSSLVVGGRFARQTDSPTTLATPAASDSEPVASTEAPAEPAAESVQPTSESPAESSAPPAAESTQPVAESGPPASESAASETPAETPTSQPSTESSAPAESSASPATESTQPVAESGPPASESAASETPAETPTSQPSTESSAPAESSAPPATESTQPAAESGPPASESPAPESATSSATGSAPQPASESAASETPAETPTTQPSTESPASESPAPESPAPESPAPESATSQPPSAPAAAASSETGTTDASASASAEPATAPTEAPAGPSQPSAKLRIPAVNFTQVNELFKLALYDDEVLAKWRKMDRTLQAGVGSVLKMVFPHVVSMASDAKVSGNCSGAILKWILSLKNMRTWAVKMLDAIGKPSAGLLEGSLTLFGNYKQCLKVRAPDEDEIEIADGEFKEYFRGQYCVLQVKPPLPLKPTFYSLNSTIESLKRPYKYYEKNVYDDLAELAMAFNFVNIRVDLCVPSLCSRDDIQRVADFLVSKVDMRARVQRCDMEPQEDQSLVEAHHLLWSMGFLLLILLVLVSTMSSLVLRLKSRTSKSRTRSLMTSMSVYRSLAHMRNVQMDRINDSKPVILYSIRIIILLWIFLVSLTSQLNFQFLRELLSLRDLIMQWPMQLIVNSSLQFDSLILITAFTYAYQNINANLSDLIKYNASKYSRLMPSIMLLVAMTIVTPLLYQSRSPVWHDFVDEPATNCKRTGLINLLFLQNFLVAPAHMCLPQTWIFCVELQLCLLSIPLVRLLNKTFDLQQGRFKLRSPAVLGLIGLAIAGCVMNYLNTRAHRLPPARFLTFPDPEHRHLYQGAHQFRTWTHLTTFAVGLLAGHLCRCLSIETFSGRPYGRRCCDNLMWLTSGLIMALLIFSTHAWSLSGRAHLEAPVASALYAALAPLLWSISMALILFQLVVPNEKNQAGSSLSRLLTSDINLVRIGRLSFLAYLLNPYVNACVLAVQEQAIFSSIFMLGHTFIGNLVFTYALAFIVSALVELPCRRLAKKLIIGPRRQCTNLDILARQLDIRHRNEGPSHDSFVAQQKQSYQPPSSPRAHLHQQHQKQAAPTMIPLK